MISRIPPRMSRAARSRRGANARAVVVNGRLTMTSEVFVYLTLPGQTSCVTAGRFALDSDRQGHSVGRFIYGRRYLEGSDAVPIDPIELKLEERTYETGRLHGMFGALRDASPDYWGRRVIEKHAGKVNLTELGYLLNSPDDKWNQARVEHAMLTLARECGLSVAQSRLTQIADRDALLVKRFDREHSDEGYRRARMLSALTLLRTEDSHLDRDRWSYPALAEELRRVCAQPRSDAPELFRRMTFNALISNLDDHPRNHAVIAMNQDWKLSPAYDLTPSIVVSLERRDLAMICGDRGRYAQAENLLSQCERFLLSRAAATRIVSDMEATVRQRWYEVARREGVSEEDCQRISSAFVHQGFRLSLGPPFESAT